MLAAAVFLPAKAQAVSAKRAYVLDTVSGRVLFEKNPDERSLIASTTKIMTALIICEQCNVLDRMRIPKEAVGIEGSSMYLQEGEVLTLQELLYGLMLSSGNDAAVALAIYCGGTVEGFAELMNDKARNLGLKDTYWIYVINGLCGSAVNVFTYRQYLVSFSSSIEEAAMIDGCTRFSIMWRIVAPISKPIIAVVLFKDFLMLWNDYMTPYMYLSQNKYPIAMALFGTSYIMPNNPGVKLVPVQNAAAILITIPTLIVFFFCQKQLVADVTAGSIKE